MKVCIVTATYPPNTVGGVSEVAYNLQKHLIECGIETVVFTSGPNHSKAGHALRTPCGKRLFVMMSLPYYLKSLRKMHFDVVNIQEENGMGIAPVLRAAKRFTKIVTTLHTSYVEEARSLRPLVVDKRVIERPTVGEHVTKYILTPPKFFGAYLDSVLSHRIIAICRKTQVDCSREFAIPETRFSVIHNGVDIERFNVKDRGHFVRAEYELGDKPVVLYVGRAEIRKGLFLLLWSLRDVMTEIPEVRLIVVGAPERTKEMESLLGQLGIRENVILAGKVPGAQLPDYYSACDITVLPSLYEGLPLVVLESMASGKPTIATKVGGVPEAVEDGGSGILFDAGNVRQMARAITFLLRDHSTRRRMGSRAREIAEKKFDWRRIAQRYKDEFELLCSAR